MPYFSDDDIAQIGSPPGRSLLGAVRLSGKNAFAILTRMSSGLGQVFATGTVARQVRFCTLHLTLSAYGENGVETREYPYPATVYLMPAPRSYTRENVVEIHIPGAPALLQATLAACVRAGARTAMPGEFTFRAFRSGRLSLGQAEAVEDVVRAGNNAELRAALSRLGDRRVSQAKIWRDRVMDAAAHIEAALDFSEEELEGNTAEDLSRIIEELEREGVTISEAGAPGDADLPRISLVGLANAGKSSLLNALLGDKTALASPEASTTRDSLRREVEWNGTRIELTDNPGYHPEGSGSGRAAADRAMAGLGSGELSCWVVDASIAPGEHEHNFARMLFGQVFIVLNKSDMPPATSEDGITAFALAAGVRAVGTASTSALTGNGIAPLRSRLANAVASAKSYSRWNRRELLELSSALDWCEKARKELAGHGRLELAADDLRRAVSAFSRALGEGYAEEALSRIFSTFCIGK